MNPEIISLLLPPASIDILSRILESHDNLGMVSTLDPERGEVLIRVTSETYPEVMEILKHLPFTSPQL
jgi:putative protease